MRILSARKVLFCLGVLSYREAFYRCRTVRRCVKGMREPKA